MLVRGILIHNWHAIFILKYWNRNADNALCFQQNPISFNIQNTNRFCLKLSKGSSVTLISQRWRKTIAEAESPGRLKQQNHSGVAGKISTACSLSGCCSNKSVLLFCFCPVKKKADVFESAAWNAAGSSTYYLFYHGISRSIWSKDHTAYCGFTVFEGSHTRLHKMVHC